jgi:GT2 family glycosyltransferase
VTNADLPTPDYETFLTAAAADCRRFRLTPWLQRDGGWMYRKIREGSAISGKRLQEIHEDIVQRDPETHLLWNTRVKPPRMCLARIAAYALIGRHFDTLRGMDRMRPGDPSFGDFPDNGGRPQRASIVVLSFNRLEYLQVTLESLFATTDCRKNELIIVDNGSTDGSAAYLRGLAGRQSHIKVILRQQNHGISPGFNCGFAHADPASDFLIKLDSDIKILTPGWLNRFIDILETDPEIGMLTLDQVNHPVLRYLPVEERHGEPLVNWVNWNIGGACMTIPRAVFNQIGYFNESFDFKYMPDEVDYYMRVCILERQAYYTKRYFAFHQTRLDKSKYRSYRSKKRDEKQQASVPQQQKLRLEYLYGERSPAVWYDHYRDCAFPRGTNLLELP